MDQGSKIMICYHLITRKKHQEHSKTDVGKCFLEKTLEAQAIQAKIMGLHQTKELLHCKENHQQMKRQPTDWQKTFVTSQQIED